MTGRQKKLMKKEIGSRIPYGLYVECRRLSVPDNNSVVSEPVEYSSGPALVRGIVGEDIDVCGYEYISLKDAKLILRPLSSMTKAEMKELEILLGHPYNFNFNEEESIIFIDFLITHRFDYRGLIEMGLAIPDEKNLYMSEYGIKRNN